YSRLDGCGPGRVRCGRDRHRRHRDSRADAIAVAGATVPCQGGHGGGPGETAVKPAAADGAGQLSSLLELPYQPSQGRLFAARVKAWREPGDRRPQALIEMIVPIGAVKQFRQGPRVAQREIAPIVGAEQTDVARDA